MKSILTMVLLVLVASFLVSAPDSNPTDAEAIKQVIVSAYQEGLINTGDVAAVRRGFHPGFNLLIKREDMLEKLPIYNWIQKTEEQVKAGKFPRKDRAAFAFPILDITGDAATVKVLFNIKDKRIFTDYLLLYRFADGWKIVAKIFHRHQ